MLCDTCKNKFICKHYEYFNNIMIDINIQINTCELYSNNNNSSPQQTLYQNQKRPTFRQPLPSTYVDKEDEVIDENEEKIFVNIDNCDIAPKNTSIVDILLKGDNNND